jgi:hypothetical protein
MFMVGKMAPFVYDVMWHYVVVVVVDQNYTCNSKYISPNSKTNTEFSTSATTYAEIKNETDPLHTVNLTLPVWNDAGATYCSC